ncbi:hypothetical protein ACH5RR_017658 [Cinchona calisaya]|uniref:Uncharacterized protein n=1 Tax=Cinchona calisaya TaxID=153742 RepID=A0ABD2ZJ86_9GENT
MCNELIIKKDEKIGTPINEGHFFNQQTNNLNDNTLGTSRKLDLNEHGPIESEVNLQIHGVGKTKEKFDGLSEGLGNIGKLEARKWKSLAHSRMGNNTDKRRKKDHFQRLDNIDWINKEEEVKHIMDHFLDVYRPKGKRVNVVSNLIDWRITADIEEELLKEFNKEEV